MITFVLLLTFWNSNTGELLGQQRVSGYKTYQACFSEGVALGKAGVKLLQEKYPEENVFSNVRCPRDQEKEV